MVLTQTIRFSQNQGRFYERSPRKMPMLNINQDRNSFVARCGEVAFISLCVCMWVSASQRIPLFALARNPHKGLAREISYETGRRGGKARSQRVNRTKTLVTVGERRRSERSGCWRRSWVQWTQKPGQPTQEDESALLVAVWEFRSDTRSR